jgi:2-desacetyl-2-hydroxyethyl bacteriochlorophyllide A dehydrogenase
MKAVQCVEPNRLAILDRSIPIPAAGEVLLRIRRVGVCGTDLHIFRGDQPYFEYPRVIGHELSGEVAAMGADIRTFSEGQAVYVIPYQHCGHCPACLRGQTNCCGRLRVLGVHIDGGLAEYVSAPERNVVPVGDITLDQAAMVEFLAIGAHGVRRGGVGADQRVLIIGAGPIGIAAAIFAGATDAEMIVTDVRQDRLDFVRQHVGASTELADAMLQSRLEALTHGDFFYVVIDATGSIGSMNQSLRWVGHGGRYVLLGLAQGALAFSDPEFHKRETTLLASRNAIRADFEHVVAAIAAGRVPTSTLNTHRGSFMDAQPLFETWSVPENHVIKGILEL